MYNEPPIAGTGLHQWILDASRELLLKGSSPGEVHETLYLLCKDRGRESNHLSREIWDALNGAVRWMEAEGIMVDPKTQKAINLFRHYGGEPVASDRLDKKDKREEYLPFDSTLQKKVLRAFSKCSLRDLSTLTSGKFSYYELFNLDFNLCFCVDVSRPMVKPLSQWENLEAMQFTIPSPLLRCGVGGQIKCDNNMAKRIYQVIEFDQVKSLDDQARLLAALGTFDRWILAMIVYSGGKSLHGWFPCYHMDHIEIRTFVREATKLGADPMLRIPSQYCRVPNGWNYKTQKRQEVLFWNSEAIEGHNRIIRKDIMES